MHFEEDVDPLVSMADTLTCFDRAEDPDQPVTGYFSDALFGLIALKVLESAGRVPPPDELAEFRERFVQRVMEKRDDFSEFQSSVSDNALDAESGGWYDASLGRSVLQIIIDDFASTALIDLIDREELGQVDEDLRRAAPFTSPLFPEVIPPGLPEHHWWWRAPSGEPFDASQLY